MSLATASLMEAPSAMGIETFGIAVAQARDSAFADGEPVSLAWFGERDGIRYAVWRGGRLREPARRSGIVVVRACLGSTVVHVDRIPRECAPTTSDGGRLMHLEAHDPRWSKADEDRVASGTLRVGLGYAAFAGAVIRPLALPQTLLDAGATEATLLHPPAYALQPELIAA